MSATTRKGKIARLPYEIREQLNAMLRDGSTAAQLNAFLIQSGHQAANDQNWTNWRQGGYQDWLKEQKRLDAVRSEAEKMRREVEAAGFNIVDKAILDIIFQLRTSDLSPHKVASALVAIKNAITNAERLKAATKSQVEKVADTAKDTALTPDQKQQRIKEIFGLA